MQHSSRAPALLSPLLLTLLFAFLTASASAFREGTFLRTRAPSVLCPNTENCAKCVITEHCGWCQVPGGEPSCVHGGEVGPLDDSVNCSCWHYDACEPSKNGRGCKGVDHPEPTMQDLSDRSAIYHSDLAYARAVREQYEKTGEAVGTRLTSSRLVLDGCENSLALLRESVKTAEAAEAAARTAADEGIEAADKAVQVAKEKAAEAENAVADRAEKMLAAQSAETQAAAAQNEVVSLRTALETAKAAVAKAKGDMTSKGAACKKAEHAVERLGLTQNMVDVDLRLRKAVESARVMDEESVASYMQAGPGAPSETDDVGGPYKHPSEHLKGIPGQEE